MRRPVNSPYTITTEFGVPDSYARFGKHSGVDYGVPLNRPIYAPISGTLTNVVSQTGGNMVVIQANGLTHRLMHNNSFSRGNGAVNEGDQVALAGTTGLSTGVHCHWDINKEGTYPTSFGSFIDPAKWLAGEYQVKQGVAMPTVAEIKAQFSKYLVNPPTAHQLTYYSTRPWNVLNDDILIGSNREKSEKIAILTKAVNELKAQVGSTDEATLLGRMLLPVITKLGYKRS